MTTVPSAHQQQILSMLERIATDTSEIKGTVAGIQADLANVKDKTARLETTVYGNGSPGMKEIVALHNQRLDCVEEAVVIVGDVPERLKKIEAALAKAEAERQRQEEKQDHIEDENRHAMLEGKVDVRKFYLGVAAAIITALLSVVFDVILK